MKDHKAETQNLVKMDVNSNLKKKQYHPPFEDDGSDSNRENYISKTLPLKLLNNIDNDTRNLCFVNSAIQLLHSIPEIRNYIKHLEYNLEFDLPVCMELKRIFKSEGKLVVSGAELRKLIGQSSGRLDMSDGSQQDIMEFHNLLLNVIEEELLIGGDLDGLRLMNKFSGKEKNEKKFINTTLGACKKGHFARTEEENFKVIKLTVPASSKEISLNNMIYNHYSEHTNKLSMKCSECCNHKKNCPQKGNCKLMEATSQKCLISNPAYLYIQLQRFANHQSLKVETRVIPENLLVMPNEEKYKLISIANHLGAKIKCGHYQTLIKIGTKWIKCDDDKHFKTSLNKEINESNYILVYEKISSVSASPSPSIIESKYDQLSEELKEPPPNINENNEITQEIYKSKSRKRKYHQLSEELEEPPPNINENNEITPEIFLDVTETEKECESTTSSNHSKGDKFLFIQGNIRFEEVGDGKIQCGICKNRFARIISHLTNNNECTEEIDLFELKSVWKKFTDKRKKTKYNQKKKAENIEMFFKEQADRRKQCDQKKKAENEELFLKEHAQRQKQCDKKKKAENEELFLKEHAKRQKHCDQKKKAENEELFFKEQANRRKQCDQKNKAENKELFLKGHAKRRKQCDQKKKAENEELFLKEHAKRQKQCDQKKKAENEELFFKEQTERRNKCDQKKKQSIGADERLNKFKQAIRFGPTYVCRCCERKLFEHQVTELDMESFKEIVEENEPGLFMMCINSYSKSNFSKPEQQPVITSFDLDMKNFLCKGCKLSMQRGKMPKMCSNNGLKVDILPEPALRLSELENNLIALNIVFQKFHLKPKSRWSGTHDRLVNIPIREQDVLSTINSLPRTPTEAGLIPVNLKRKLEYKTTHLQQLIDPRKIYKYLYYLKYVAQNQHYRFYDDYNVFITRCQERDPEGFKLIDPERDDVIENLDLCQSKSYPKDQIDEENDEFEREDFEYRTHDPVRKYQFDYDMTTCMLPKFPEAISEIGDEETSFAPGEGKIPTNILKEDNWDVKSFPNIHPTGKNGLHQKRTVKGLTDQQYIEQRLKNQDNRFEQCTPYVFALTAYIEEKQLERNIGISYSKGKKTTGENGERSYTLNDGFAVLDNIKGTPRYWKKAKMEMLAKLDNFGPFHIFYTLSCGDMRWNENFTSILREKGYNIIWTADKGCLDQCPEVKIEVEFIKEGVKKPVELREFLQKEVDESLHEFIRTNVFIATRNFMHRLKTFRKEIMTGENNPMGIENWSDKMEFQGRGAAHIHGVAWCNLAKVSQMLKTKNEEHEENDLEDESDYDNEDDEFLGKKCDLEKAFDKLRMNGKLKNEEEKALIAFADRFTTCTLNPATAANMIDETTSILEGIKIVTIAKETQTHHHTKTCKKHSPDCRFGIPRFPIWKTMLSKPIEGESAEEISDIRIKHKEVLKRVLAVLEDKEEMAKIWKDYDKQTETIEEYGVNRKQRILKALELAGVSPKCYEAAVREQTRKGVNIILARDIDEMYINNYNPEWIRAWDANMDIQPCFDFFAVITYVTEYFTKDESGTSRLLKMAAKVCSELELTQQKRHIKNTFLTNRQIGISEAYMRILPEFRLKDSTIGTDFLQHGKREDMSRFVVRAHIAENEEERSIASNPALFRILGRDGLYYEKPNWINKYFRRGNILKDICPTHLAKMYDPDTQGSKKEIDVDQDEDNGDEDEDRNDFAETVKKYGKEAKYHHTITSNGKPGKKLPKYVELENPFPGEPKFLRKRKHPKAIRYYKVKEDSNPSRFFLQELMFYTNFDEATYNEWHDESKCAEAYILNIDVIKAVKKQVMEWIDDVDEARYYVEETLKNEAKVEEYGDLIDAQNKQDVLECEEEGNEADPLYGHLDLGDHNEHEFLPSFNWYKKIDLKDNDQLSEETQNLDKFQRKTLDIGLKYAREIVKARNHKNEMPEAPRMIVLGGAGSGKSTVIDSLKQWIEKTLQKPGDEPQTPYILPTATTGAASVIIEGMTLHTAVGLDFSNRHNSLSDKKRELKRNQFKNLKFLITDEFSMMKSDQLYQLDLRLRELKQNNRLFGGVAVFLLGDPAQLRPVKGRFSFDQPSCEDYHLAYQSESLWKSFQVINLTENHRQGNDKTYADILNRVRVGEQTKEDIELLRKRVRPKNHPDLRNALYIACKKVSVTEHNTKCLNSLPGKLYEIEARHFTKLKHNYKPYIQKDGTISDTQFPNALQLKIGAKVMLIYNVDVSDLLCNGAMGTLIGVEESEGGSVDKLIIKFANQKAGKERRKNHPNYAKRYPEGTVITKMEREYTIAKKANTVVASTAKLVQYPVVLAFAVTVHKIQGQTIERPLKCVIDLRSVFEGAQAYVMMSRIKELEQLYILEELPNDKIYPIEKALDEIKRLQEVSINNNPTSWDIEIKSNVRKISYLNTRSIVRKFANITSDLSLQQSDLLILAETWIQGNTDSSSKYKLRDYNTHLNSTGKGRGLALFSKPNYKKIIDHNEKNIDITKIESKDMDVIAIYRSENGCVVSLIIKLQEIINYSKSTLIVGDMNICNKKMEQNQLRTFLEGKAFNQIVNKATHIDGGHINHAYIMNVGNFEDTPDIELIPKYYSDHDAICISWKKVNPRLMKKVRGSK